MTLFIKFISIVSILVFINCQGLEIKDNADVKIITNKIKAENFHGNIMSTTDLGATWKDIGSNLPNAVDIRSINVNDNHIYVGNSKVYVNNIYSPSQWTEENLNEQFFYTEPGNKSIAMFFSMGTKIYATTIFGDLFRKTDNNSLWTPIVKPEIVHVVADLKEVDGKIYIATDYGLYVSKNDGANWKQIYERGPLYNVSIKNNLISLSGQGGTFYSDDEGKNWAASPLVQNLSMLNLDNRAVHHQLLPYGKDLAALRFDETFTNGAKGKIQISKDGGKTWQIPLADAYLKNLRNITKVFILEDKIYCSYAGGIICSEDDGKTWNHILIKTKDNKNSTLDMNYHKGIIFCYEKMAGC